MQQERFEWADSSNAAAPAPATPRQPELRGEVIFASEEEQVQRSTELLGAGALVVTVPPPQKETHGRLGEIIEEIVERELARAGAPSPYLAAWSAMPEDAQARLADQLFRVRTVGATGLAIVLGSLRAIGSPTLTPDDSATLRWLADTTADAPLVVLVDDADLMMPGYAAPLPLGALLATRRPMWEMTPSSIAPVAESGAELDVEVDVEVAVAGAPGILDPVLEVDVIEESSPAVLTGDDATTNETRVASIDVAEAIAQAAPAVDEEAVPVMENVAEEVIEPAPPTMVEPATHAATAPSIEHELSPVDPVELPQVVVDSVLATKKRGRRASAGVPVSGPNDAWRSWAIALAAAKGPQPLATFERLFAESYVPLSNAIAAGLDDARALRAYEEFRRSFERSYSDAFAAFGATNRRARLVMDAYDLASKQARLSNARSSHVLLVDSMRFDLGCLVRDALTREAAGLATLTSESVLWSALPTTTFRQIETLARGLDALRDPAREDREEASESLRGRASEVVRRLRVGSRELYKLDIVPAMLEATDDIVGSLDSIAASTAESIARHVSTLPARTLLFVVGDHGFSIDRRGTLKTGGASPEEVLVPAFSWLVGDLH